MKATFTIVRTTQYKCVWDAPFKAIEGSEAVIRVSAESQAAAIRSASELSGEFNDSNSRYVYRVIEITEVAE